MAATLAHHFQIKTILLPATKSIPPSTPVATSISFPRPHLSSTAIPPILSPPPIENPPLPKDSLDISFWDYQMLFLSQRSETSSPIPIPISSGSIPSDFPIGTYYLAGPGIFSDDHGSTIHPLDGHGYLRSFEFCDGGAVRYSARYVETDAKKEESEEETWRFSYRGPFSMLMGGKKVGNFKVMKNVANTAVVRWGGRLLCLWEGGNPYEIDGRTMETIGAVDLISDGDPVGCRPWRRFRDVGLDLAAAMLKPLLQGE